MIDLSTCAPGQKVRLANGKIGEVLAGTEGSGHTKKHYVKQKALRWWCTSDGIQCNNTWSPGWEIVEILPLETPEEQPMPTPQEMDYKKSYIEIANILSVAFPECEITTVDMARLIIHENRTLRLALALPTYEEVEDLLDYEVIG